MISPFAAWYRTGTIAATQNSATITGTGTSWLFGDTVREGDLFTIDGSKFYEVATVGSATSLTLRTPFLETTVTGSAYAIIRNFAVIPATEIIIRCLDTTNIWKTFQDQMYTWQTLPYNGVTPATVDFVGLDGAITTIKSLPQVVGETNIASTKGLISLNLLSTPATTENLDWNVAGHRQIVVDKNITLTFTNPTQAARLTLLCTRSGTDPYTITLPNTVRNKDGSNLASITLDTTAQVIDLLWNGTFYYRVNS